MSDSEKIRVLYIEDDLANLKVLESFFGTRDDYQFHGASNGAEGLSLAATLPVDVVLVDINLPIMDGYNVLSKLRSLSAYARTPILAISANGKPNDIEKGLQAGFNSYITKPFDLKALESVIKKVLNTESQATP